MFGGEDMSEGDLLNTAGTGTPIISMYLMIFIIVCTCCCTFLNTFITKYSFDEDEDEEKTMGLTNWKLWVYCIMFSILLSLALILGLRNIH